MYGGFKEFFSVSLRYKISKIVMSFPDGSMVENPSANVGDSRDTGSIPGWGGSSRVGNGN